MKILALEHEVPGAKAEQFEQYAKDEARRVWELTQTGLFRESYFRADRNEAVLILECESVDQSEDVLKTLPFVRAGLIRFEIIPLKAYPGFARLFVAD